MSRRSVLPPSLFGEMSSRKAVVRARPHVFILPARSCFLPRFLTRGTERSGSSWFCLSKTPSVPSDFAGAQVPPLCQRPPPLGISLARCVLPSSEEQSAGKTIGEGRGGLCTSAGLGRAARGSCGPPAAVPRSCTSGVCRLPHLGPRKAALSLIVHQD